jgi:hypothetical protein
MHTEFLLQIQKQQEDLAMVLSSNKRQGENTKWKHTTERRLNTQKMATEKSID